MGTQSSVMSHVKLPITFSFSSTLDDASIGTKGQTTGLGQGSRLRETLLKMIV